MFKFRKSKEEIDQWEEIYNENMKALEEYGKHFDGYGNVKCEYCENWVDTEYMGNKCPVCNAEIPKYKFEMKG